MLKSRPSFLYEDANAPLRETWIRHAGMLAYVTGWLTVWAALAFSYPVLRIVWIFSLPAAALVLWTWFTDDEN